MKRAKLSRLQRVRIFDRAKGICSLCALKIHAERGEKFECHHAVPLWLGGADDESNLVPAHKTCHAKVSANDNPERAKADRIRANYLGVERTKSPLPCGRNTGFKKTMRHGVVKRMSQSAMHREMVAKRNGGGE